MKIAYIGTKDQLAETFIERMNKEGNDVYFLSVRDFPRTISERWKYRFYKISLSGDNYHKTLQSIRPDWVVFAGTYFMDCVYQEKEEEDVTLLTRTLQILSDRKDVRFLLLSSTEVYGKSAKKADEQQTVMPVGERGMRFVREEQMLQLYGRQYGLYGAVIRASSLYADQAREGATDFLSRGFADVMAGKKGTVLVNDILQPLHTADLVDAVKRVMDSEKQGVYNAAGSFEISRKRLFELIGKRAGVPEEKIQWEETDQWILADNGRLKKETEWTDFHKLEDQFADGGISYEKAAAKSKRVRKGRIPAGIRRTLENLLVFSAFFAVNYISAPHSLFSRIEWLTIYVILISVFLGIRQSTLAVILASAAYLFMQDLNIFNMTNFYSYAGSVLKIMEFVFLGLVISYVTDMLREELRDTRRELVMREEEYEELKAINDENVMIKNEYEERILDSKYGFPKLYRVVSRLMVQQPERIFMEIVSIVSEMVHTDTVAVYRVKEDSPYLRLINALNEESAQEGKSWNLTAYPDIQASVIAGELYQGDVWKGEPAIVLPILYQGNCVAAILIKTLPYTSQTLYYVNLLKTLSLLLREAVGRALDHEELMKEEIYLQGTEVMKPEPFHRNILLAGERAEKKLAEYCVVQITGRDGFEEACRKAAEGLRATDCLGTDGSGNLYVLLNNTGTDDVEYLQKRLAEGGLDAKITTAFEDSEEMEWKDF